EDGIQYFHVTGVQTCALPIYARLERDVSVTDGTGTVVRLELVPTAMEVEGVVATVDATPQGARTLSGADLRALSASTVGEVVATDRKSVGRGSAGSGAVAASL